jgi:molybdate/tungstate transport system substrate-binding protein
MVYQLAEEHYREAGLAARLAAASPPRFMRPKEADLVALLQAGELDYAWSYRSIATTVGLRHVSLPPEVDLSDPARAEWYSRSAVRLPGSPRTGTDSVEFRGEPIVYGLTIPRTAANPAAARALIRFLFSGEGQAILRRNGFVLLEGTMLGGPEPPPADVFSLRASPSSPEPRAKP